MFEAIKIRVTESIIKDCSKKIGDNWSRFIGDIWPEMSRGFSTLNVSFQLALLYSLFSFIEKFQLWKFRISNFKQYLEVVAYIKWAVICQ